jgi:glycosyltransferase involved in cell wall biosynthesis
MRILYVLTSLGIGGAERQTLAVASRMAQRGHTVSLLVLRPELTEEWPTSLPVVHLNMRKAPWRVLASLLAGRRFLRQFQPDLIHSHCFHANLVARLLRRAIPSARLLCTIHNVYEGGWHRMLLYRLTDRRLTRTTAVSGAAMRRFVACGAVAAAKCMVVGNGIDVDAFAPCPSRRTAMRTEMCTRAEFIWLAAGRITPAKDISNLLRAFTLIGSSHPDARLWVAGAPTEEEFEKVNTLARELGVTGSVCWLGLRRDLPALMDAADGFVLSSAWEGMPLVVGEAMAFEKPVVATDAGGVRELVGDAALVVPIRDPEALATAMGKVMEMTAEERSALGRAARTRMLDQFSMEAKACEWEALYGAVLSE